MKPRPPKPVRTSRAAVLGPAAVEAVRRGHPWIFRDALRAVPSEETGAAVELVTESGERLGMGLWDAVSPIALRVWTRGEPIDAALFRARLDAALVVRARLFTGTGTTAYRVLNGEGDRTPGFVVDRYDDVAVLRVDGDAARAAVPRLLQGIEPVLRAHGVTTLLDRVAKKGEAPLVTPVFGPMRESVTAQEHGVPFMVDLVRGQKTGAFLDQRENRRRIGELAARRTSPRVLNLFSYTGGFSLRAALAGATVTSVDVAMAAHATAQASFKLAGVDPKAHAFVTADCFAFLEAARKRGDRFDIVISDPPSFAPSEKAKQKGLSAYRALHRACVGVLAEGGTFVAASCSSHVGLEDFSSTLDDAALGRSDLRMLEMFGPPADHPTLAVFPEGRYLKLCVLE